MLGLEGVYGEVSSLGHDWLNVQAGVSQLSLAPAGPLASQHSKYLLSGSAANKYLSGRCWAVLPYMQHL